MKNRSKMFFVFAIIFLVSFSACDNNDDDDDSEQGSGNDDDDDSQEGPVDDNERDNPAQFLVITSENMETAWLGFAGWKERTGIRTDVVLIEDILGYRE